MLLRILISFHERYPAAGLDALVAMIKPICPCSRNTVHRLMKLHNIHSIRKKAFKVTTNSNHNYAVSPNLLKRDFNADKPNQKWVGDITYIPTDEGWLYAAIVKDLCLKKIVGYAFSSRIDTNLTVSALEMAVNRQKPQGNLLKTFFIQNHRFTTERWLSVTVKFMQQVVFCRSLKSLYHLRSVQGIGQVSGLQRKATLWL